MGNWIKEGTVIYTFNGETLGPEIALSTYILNELNIDPDGYVRATVRYKDPETGTIDRGLLAVPVFRQVTLADGTILEIAVEDLRWVVRVKDTPTQTNGLRAGDILLGETSTGIGFLSPEDIATAMDHLTTSLSETAIFEIRRDGTSAYVGDNRSCAKGVFIE